MHNHFCSKALVFILFLDFVLFVWGCGDNYRDESVKVDYYVINTRLDEILVKNRDAANGIVGFFLGSGEVYHFEYHGQMAIKILDDNPHSIRITFDFYASGKASSFTEHIGAYEFYPEFNSDYACVETCFVR